MKGKEQVFEQNQIYIIITKGTYQKPKAIEIVFTYDNSGRTLCSQRVWGLNTINVCSVMTNEGLNFKYSQAEIFPIWKESEDQIREDYGFTELIPCSKKIADYIKYGEQHLPFGANPYSNEVVYLKSNLEYLQRYAENYFERVQQGLPATDLNNGWFKYADAEKSGNGQE